MNPKSFNYFKHVSKAAARDVKLLVPDIHARPYLVLVRKL